jgi:hypothetical protein
LQTAHPTITIKVQAIQNEDLDGKLEDTFTLPLGVQAFASQYPVDTANLLAFTSLSMIPALVFFSLFDAASSVALPVRSRGELRDCATTERRKAAG